MASPMLRNIRLIWFACVAGIYGSYLTLGLLIGILGPPTVPGRTVLLILAGIIGGASARQVAPSAKTFPCAVISVMTTSQLCGPLLGPGAIRLLPMPLGMVIAGFVASYFGHTLTGLSTARKQVRACTFDR
jgi:hypothetical protein